MSRQDKRLMANTLVGFLSLALLSGIATASSSEDAERCRFKSATGFTDVEIRSPQLSEVIPGGVHVCAKAFGRTQIVGSFTHDCVFDTAEGRWVCDYDAVVAGGGRGERAGVSQTKAEATWGFPAEFWLSWSDGTLVYTKGQNYEEVPGGGAAHAGTICLNVATGSRSNDGVVVTVGVSVRCGTA